MPLAILVASQKGLSGTFNHNLFRYFAQNPPPDKCKIIAIGKKAINFITNTKYQMVKQYDHLSSKNTNQIAQELYGEVAHSKPNYTNVTVYSNVSLSFFVQKPQLHQLIPFEIETKKIDRKHKEDLIWEQSEEIILEHLVDTYLRTTLSEYLFQSLLSEQAARFVSMDGATKNADNMLTDMTLAYNKIRQAKITRELTDLSDSFQTD